MSDSPPPSWYEPPGDDWGVCPECGANQEDAEYDRTRGLYVCPCGREYDEAQAHPDPSDDEPHDFDEWREERGL